MKTSVAPLEGNKVKVSVEVDVDEFEHEMDAAFRRIAREVRMPGFRPGKAPRRILESRLGSGPAREDALRHALPDYYAKAVREHDIDVIAPPEIDITAGEEEGPIAFEAVVEVRPVVEVAGYASLRITIDNPIPTDADVDAQIDRLREQSAELEAVDRPAAAGDHVTIDINGSRDGEALSGLSAEGYLYEVGSGAVVPELDEQLTGASAGDELSFTADHPNPDEDPIDFTVTVVEVKEKVLPDADDEWAAEASEFETLAELRQSLFDRASTMKRVQAQMQHRERAASALAELVIDDVPEALVAQEVQNRLQDMAMRLQAQGMDLNTYMQMTGQDPEALTDSLKEQAEEAVRVDLGLRAVAEAQGIEVSDDDLEEELVRLSARVGEKLESVRKQLERNEQMSAVRSDLRQRKALDWLLEAVEVVDEDGNPIDPDTLVIDESEVAPHDHDHDHDHDHHHEAVAGEDDE